MTLVLMMEVAVANRLTDMSAHNARRSRKERSRRRISVKGTMVYRASVMIEKATVF